MVGLSGIEALQERRSKEDNAVKVCSYCALKQLPLRLKSNGLQSL